MYLVHFNWFSDFWSGFESRKILGKGVRKLFLWNQTRKRNDLLEITKTCQTILRLIFTDLINRWFHGLSINFRNLIESLQLEWKFGETQHMCLKLHTSSLSKNRLFVTNDNSATKMLYLRQKPEIILSINCHDSWQFALSAKS